MTQKEVLTELGTAKTCGKQTTTVNGQTKQYSANLLNQYDWSSQPGAIDVVGEADSASVVEVNALAAARQGKFYHKQLAVSNSVAPQYEHVTVAIDDMTKITLEETDVYVPKENISYSYDADGNLLADGRWNYTWDGENRLIGMETISAVPAAAKRKLQFAYDFMSRRMWKSSQTWDTSASAWDAPEIFYYGYDGWNLACIMDGNGQAIKRFTWGTDLSGTMQGAGGVGGLLSMSERQPDDSWQTSYAVSDANGNVMKLVDAQTLDTVAEYDYGPFGELIRMTGPRAKANPFRFSSKYQDEESGLLYYGFRYYDAGMGRWLNRDPIGEDGSDNIYSFILNCSIHIVDFLGLLPYGPGLTPVNWPGIPADFPKGHDSLFVGWYFTMNGLPLDVIGAGYGGKIIPPIETRSIEELRKAIAEYLRRQKCDKERYGGTEPYSASFRVPVDLTRIVFSLGDTHPHFATAGQLTWSCCENYFVFKGTASWLIDDDFKDVLDWHDEWDGNQEFPGGVAYPITGGWSDRISATGTIY